MQADDPPVGRGPARSDDERLASAPGELNFSFVQAHARTRPDSASRKACNLRLAEGSGARIVRISSKGYVLESGSVTRSLSVRGNKTDEWIGAILRDRK